MTDCITEFTDILDGSQSIPYSACATRFFLISACELPHSTQPLMRYRSGRVSCFDDALSTHDIERIRGGEQTEHSLRGRSPE